jgi:signal transduction histidine kinase/HPt (histidine-containing phosphotransfer) domain-containing protein
MADDDGYTSTIMEEKARILIIDDDMVDRRAISRALHASGMPVDVSEAASIRSGWERIEQGPWDCVFLDYLLPGGDGLDLLLQFREAGHQMPIVVVTSQGDEKIAVKVMKAGGSDYITKNLLSSEAVSSVVRRVIRTHNVEIERLKTAQALADSEARLAEAQRIADIGSWEMDAHTLEEFWTNQVFAILGEPDGGNRKMGRRTLKHHILLEDVVACMAAYQEIVSIKEARKVDVRLRTLSGAIRQVELQGKPVLGLDGHVVKIIGTIQDITPRKEIEQALREAKDLAERNSKAKEEFLANMSHEIRTPMNAILGFAKLLQDSPMDSLQQEYLHAINSSGEGLLAIINDILDLSKIEAGKMTFEAQPFSIVVLLQSLKDLFAPIVKEKNLALTTMIGPGVPEWIVGDIVKLRQVLLNLVSNALKFTAIGEVNVEVKLLNQSGTTCDLLFEVADTGIGIAADKQRSIFDSFTQARSDTTRKYGGTGLGLTICKRIVELQGGRIGLESALGDGSNFYFELQFEIAAPSPQHTAAQVINDGETQGIPIRRVLLAEDNKLNQRLATIILERMGFSYVIANTGQEAVDLVQKERPDIVLMDIQMPDMDGYEATRQIRKLDDPVLRAVPIIALTAHALREEVEKSLAAGMNAFIAKPFQAAQLREAILQLTQQRPSQPLVQAATETPTQPLTLDLRPLEDLVGENAMLRQELVNIFLEEVPKAIEKMQDALKQGDAMGLYRLAHSIKPSLLLFGLPDAAQTLKILEAAEHLDMPGEPQHAAYVQLRASAHAACDILAK